jgi:pyruvate ferredoxin oxidoreductase gamma subunit
MFQVRIHGRGGQGVVSGAQLLSVAGFLEGRHAQAIPSFGSERMGTPVIAYCRLDDKPIRLREPVLEPDALIVQDATLLHRVDLFTGLRQDGYILLNSTQSFEELGLAEFAGSFRRSRLCTVRATEIAITHVGRAVPNVPLLGAFAAITGQVRLESVIAAIRKKFPHAVAEQNVAAAAQAFEIVGKTRETADA